MSHEDHLPAMESPTGVRARLVEIKNKINFARAVAWWSAGAFAFFFMTYAGQVPDDSLRSVIPFAIKAMGWTLVNDPFGFFMGIFACFWVAALLPLPTGLLILIVPKYRKLSSVGNNYRVWYVLIWCLVVLGTFGAILRGGH